MVGIAASTRRNRNDRAKNAFLRVCNIYGRIHTRKELLSYPISCTICAKLVIDWNVIYIS